ncbi:MAG: DUF6062 family protein [Firmicutes bacterium]|nr:DUF6062 family protein [Bacillota bacterium]
MKEKIYTIPITDGFAQKTECPFCAIYRKVEDDAVNFMLGPAYMDKDVRMRTNETGFCPEHYKRLYDGQNRLGLALTLHTHLHSVNGILAAASVPERRGRIARKPGGGAESGLAGEIRKIYDSCFICDRIGDNFGRYIENFFYMWKHMPEFAETVGNCRGFCLKHFTALVEAGEKLLSAGDFHDFAETALRAQRDAFAALEADVGRFIQKFDYRNKDMPWDGAQDAVIRALMRVASVDAVGGPE